MMKAEFSTMGSCSSRNIFNSEINNDYKSYFKINHSIERVNLISLMSKSVEYDSGLINSDHGYDNTCVIEDFSKRYLDSIKNENFDYIILDNYFDVVFSIIELNRDSFITDSYSLEHTDIYKQFKDFRRINVSQDFDEYFKLWKNAFDLFFIYFKENCSDTILILNCSRAVYKYCEDDSIFEDSKLKKESLSCNRHLNVLDRYILENYDVEVLPFDYGTLADKSHIFGFAQTHYESKYYNEKNRQLNEIIKFNTLFEYDDELYADFRNLKRENEIHKMELYELNEFKIPELNHTNQVLKEKYESILSSNSWKLTKPLRNIKKFNK